MRVLNIRRGFQADHSSSSYVFYAVDRPVSAAGQRVAHRYSSRAEVDARSARYEKWGDSDLAESAYKALLGEHYDLMASESYDWWTMRIAVPKTAAMRKLLDAFADARGVDDQGVDVEDYGARLAAVVHCRFDYSASLFERRRSPLDALIKRLETVRSELLAGNASFLRAVVERYQDDDEDEDDGTPARPSASRGAATKAELLAECARRRIEARPSWTKARIEAALAAAPRRHTKPAPPKLSRVSRDLVDAMVVE